MKRATMLLLAAFMAVSAAGCTKREKTFTDSLPSNPTTGYDWVLAENGGADGETGKVDVRLDYVPDEAAQGLAGAGGSTRVTITGVTPGNANVTLCYVRSWEWDGDPATAEATAVYGFEVKKDLSLDVLGAMTMFPDGMRAE